ncbi:glycosyltransferase [Kibdelosporangium aridum]|uniref:glycosyltransferase n=1 Tax=Kibdelosporangium aridum TaxID=2030 RepID=UPI0035E9FD7A
MAYRESLGLPGDPDGENLHRAPSFSLLPPSLEVPRAEAGPEVHRFRVPAAAGSAPLRDWWANDDAPLVYATFGTVAAGVPFAAAAFRTVVEALAELPVRVLVTVGDSGDPSTWSALPPNVHVERWVPQQDVLVHAAAMVCHGGTGTVLGGLAAGVPMVVVPQFADQPDNAERVAAVSAGIGVGDGGSGAGHGRGAAGRRDPRAQRAVLPEGSGCDGRGDRRPASGRRGGQLLGETHGC